LAANFNQGVSGGASSGDIAALDAFAQANGLMADVPEPALARTVPLAVLPFLTRHRRRAIQTICL
jgi:hypothetical protein